MKKTVFIFAFLFLTLAAFGQTTYGGGAGQTTWFAPSGSPPPPPPPPTPGENAYCNPGASPELSEGTPTWGTNDGYALLDDKCFHTALSSTPTGTRPDLTPGLAFNPVNATALSAVFASANGGTGVSLSGGSGSLHLTCGDNIVLNRNTTYTAPSIGFVVPNIGCDGLHWIFMMSTGVADPLFPLESQMATPCVAGISNDAVNGRNNPGYPDYSCPGSVLTTPLTAKIQQGTGNLTLTFAAGANHYRFIGIEVTKNPSILSAALVSLAADHATLGANHIIFDRSPIHGEPWTVASTNADSTQGGISAEGSNYVAFVNSWIWDIYCITSCVDSQAFNGGTNINQDGRFKIYNFLLASSGETYLFGGGGLGTGMPNTRGLEIRFGQSFKPLTWMVPIDTCSSLSNVVTKNLGEFKNMTYAFVEAVIFENSWQGCQSDQAGFAMLLNPSSQNNHVAIKANFNGTAIATISGTGSFTQVGLLSTNIPNDPVGCPPGGCVLEISDPNARAGIDDGLDYVFCNTANGCDQSGVANLKCAYGSAVGSGCASDSSCPGSSRVGRCAPTTSARMTASIPTGSAINVNSCVPGDCPTCRNSHILYRYNKIINATQGIQVNTGLSSHCHDEAAGMENVTIRDWVADDLSRYMSNGSDPYSGSEFISIGSNIEGNVLHNIEVAHITAAVEGVSTTGSGFGDQVDHTNRHHLLGLKFHDIVSTAGYYINRSSGSLVTKGILGASGLANTFAVNACRSYWPVEAPTGIVLAGNLTNFTLTGFATTNYMVVRNGQQTGIAANPANWSGVTNYTIGDKATYAGIVYFSLQPVNTNNQPDINPTWWRPGFTLAAAAVAGDEIKVADLNDCPFVWAGNILGAGLTGSGTPYDPYPNQNSCGISGTSACLLSGSAFTNIFANWNNGRNGDYTITSATYQQSATDASIRPATGKDPGADIVTLEAKIAGVRGTVFLPTLTVTSGTITGATVGTPYTFALAASTGASPFKAWFLETTSGNCGGSCGTLAPGIVIGRGGVVNGPFAINNVAVKNNKAKITLKQTIVAGANSWTVGQNVLLAGFCIDGVGSAAWSSGTTYASGAQVTYSAKAYTSLQGSNLNHQPDISPTWWRLACVGNAVLDGDLNGTWAVVASSTDCTNATNVVCLGVTHADIAAHAPSTVGANNPVGTFAPTAAGTYHWWMGAKDGAFQIGRAQINLTVAP